MKITLLGFTLDPESMEGVIQADSLMPIQTQTFAWSLVEALRSAGIEVTLLSSAPASNYPRNKRLWFRGGSFIADGVQGEYLGFVNLMVLKHLSRFSACLTRGRRALRRWDPDILLIHGVHSPFLAFGALVRAASRTKTVVVATDPPGVVLPSDGVIAQLLKRLDIGLVRRALVSTDGIIALTSPLARDFAPGADTLVLEGIVDSAASLNQGIVEQAGFHILYAGGLVPEYGVDRLVTAVRGMPDPDIRLSVFGRGSLAPWIDGQASLDRRIGQSRFVARETVLMEYAGADLLLQPRPVDQGFVQYSFPSKLLEYMASGTPVLTTRLPGIPNDYDPFVYWIDDDSAEGIQTAVRRVLALSNDERRRKGRLAADFVRNSRSSAAQGARIRAFLQRVSAT